MIREAAFCGWNLDPNILQIGGGTLKKVAQLAFMRKMIKAK